MLSDSTVFPGRFSSGMQNMLISLEINRDGGVGNGLAVLLGERGQRDQGSRRRQP
jgi:hypothetical protein